MVDSFSIDDRVISINERSLSFLEAGQGEALALLHGIGSSARSWMAQIEGLSDAFHVVAWNAPGYAQSTRLSDPSPTVEAYAEIFAHFLQSQMITHCHVVGHSLGALMAARFACNHPERVMSLTLASCALGHARLAVDERARLLRSRLDDLEKFGPAGMAHLRASRLLSQSANPTHIEAVRQNMAGVDPRGYAQAARMLGQSDLLADIERLPRSVPLQVVYGDADVITPPQVNQRAASARPDTLVRTIAGAGHALYVEAANEFNAAIRDFTGRCHAIT